MSPNAAELLDIAADAATRAYVPYSGFRVGAAVVDEHGKIYTGANVENASYGATVCAETTAVATAVATGVRRIDTVAVVCLDGDICTPCGNCRQVLREFGVSTVVMQAPDGSPQVVSLDELLPMSFGPEALS